MEENQAYTLDEADLHFAKALNGKVWELLQKAQRTTEEDELMVHCAHASCYHWLQKGTPLQHQRAEWLVAHVYTVLEIPDSALRHASRCLELTRTHASLMEDFDVAYAYEGFARASALAGNRESALEFIPLAERAGLAIANEEDRSIFMGDWNSGRWYGLR
jgi:hypothetical protein